MADQSRENNPNWKGGRSVASNGYVIVRVGVGHHLADVRGYAYEHRIVAEQKIGRRLNDGEIVHHINENKQDNRPENLKVVASGLEHFAHHLSDLTIAVYELISYFPCCREQLAEYTGATKRQIGWALQRLRMKGKARLTDCKQWIGT